MSKTTKKLFNKGIRNTCKEALRVLEKRGWCRKKNIDKRGRVCLDGALLIATGVDPEEYHFQTMGLHPNLSQEIVKAIELKHPRAVEVSYLFNDASSSSKRVKELLKFMIEAEK